MEGLLIKMLPIRVWQPRGWCTADVNFRQQHYRSMRRMSAIKTLSGGNRERVDSAAFDNLNRYYLPF